MTQTEKMILGNLLAILLALEVTAHPTIAEALRECIDATKAYLDPSGEVFEDSKCPTNT
jgi:hypothetical protein